MAAKSWIVLPIAACCAIATVTLPAPRHFYSAFWASFTSEKLADQIGILVSFVGLFGVQISAAIGTVLFWNFREMEALRSQVAAAHKRYEVAESRTKEAESKVEKLRRDLKSVEESTPDQFLRNAMLSDSGRSTKTNVIPTLEKGLLASVAPLAAACRLLAQKLLDRDEAGDFPAAERAATLATVLAPDDPSDRKLASVIVERKAADAFAKGTYSTFDPRFTPIPAEDTTDPVLAEELSTSLFNKCQRSIREGEYFVALRLAERALLAATASGSQGVYLDSCYVRAVSLRYLGRFQDALAIVDGYAEREVNVLGESHVNVKSTRAMRADLLENIGRFEDAARELDKFPKQFPHGGNVTVQNWCRNLFQKAHLLLKAGQYQMAMDAVELFAEHEARALGEDHSDVYITACLKSDILSHLQRPDEALRKIDGFASAQSLLLGAKHPDVFLTHYLRARVLTELGNYDEAQKELDAFSAAQADTLGADHQYVTLTRQLRDRLTRR